MLNNSTIRTKLFLLYENVYFIVFPIVALILFSIIGGVFLFEIIFSNLSVIIVSLGWKRLYLAVVLFTLFLWFFFFVKKLFLVQFKQYFFLVEYDLLIIF